MGPHQPNNPLHGATLKALLTELVEKFGWETLGTRVRIRCFTHEPTIGSSLAFLRRTPWARDKVERIYLEMVAERAFKKMGKRGKRKA
jgi:uncharacterized protein (DUF2132 family)